MSLSQKACFDPCKLRHSARVADGRRRTRQDRRYTENQGARICLWLSRLFNIIMNLQISTLLCLGLILQLGSHHVHPPT